MIPWRRWVVKCFQRGQIVSLDKIELWCDSFGRKEDPVFLLIMGGGCQGILWPEIFCEKLASLGFFVVRFDSRDTGYSSYFDYTKNPYTLLDMAEDAASLLDHLGVASAHVMGTSMGGAIAQLLAAYYPSKVLSLTLLATTVDLRNLASVIQGDFPKDLPLAFPSQQCLDWISYFSLHHPRLSWWKKVSKQLEGWKILNGPIIPFDKKYYFTMLCKSILRQRSYQSLLNHVYALSSSCDQLLGTVGKIHAPVLVIQGDQDPIFPKDHGEFLARSLPQSHLVIVEKMGHNLNSCFYDTILQEIDRFVADNSRKNR